MAAMRFVVTGEGRLAFLSLDYVMQSYFDMDKDEKSAYVKNILNLIDSLEKTGQTPLLSVELSKFVSRIILLEI